MVPFFDASGAVPNQLHAHWLTSFDLMKLQKADNGKMDDQESKVNEVIRNGRNIGDF